MLKIDVLVMNDGSGRMTMHEGISLYSRYCGKAFDRVSPIWPLSRVGLHLVVQALPVFPDPVAARAVVRADIDRAIAQLSQPGDVL